MGKGRIKLAAQIRQHSRIQHQQMLAQDEEKYKRRNRLRNGLPSKEPIQLRRLKLLYIPTVVLLCTGLVMIFGSIVQGLGQGTIFWENKEQFYVIGPIVLTVGVIFLFVTVGLMTHHGAKRTIQSNETIKSLAEQNSPFTQESFVYDPTWKVESDNGCSIPIMGFEDEEYYVKNVKKKPMDYREGSSSNHKQIGLPEKQKEAVNNNHNNFSVKELNWSDNLPPNYNELQSFEADISHASTPLLAGKDILSQKRVVFKKVIIKEKRLGVPLEDIWKLPESNI